MLYNRSLLKPASWGAQAINQILCYHHFNEEIKCFIRDFCRLLNKTL